MSSPNAHEVERSRDRRFFLYVAGAVVSLVAAAVVFIPSNPDEEARPQADATHAGRGDAVVEISKPAERLPALLVVLGNQERRRFAIVARDSSGNRLGTLIDTTDPYVGIVPIDLPPTTHTRQLEITATGSWRIYVYPIGMAHKISVPGTREGEGDNVLWVVGEADRATIRGNAASRDFAVTAWDRNGNRRGLVDTADPYSGTVAVPPQTLLLQISAAGRWSVDLR